MRRRHPRARAARRTPRDNKYSAGSVLVVGGSPGLTGAAASPRAAAFRADAGYVTVAARRVACPVIEARLLEAVKRPLETSVLDGRAARAAGRARARARPRPRRREARRSSGGCSSEIDLPAVVDADALFGLEPFERAAPTVLTPHAGELARLLGDELGVRSTPTGSRPSARGRAFGCVVLLKGADTLVAAPGARACSSPGSAAVARDGRNRRRPHRRGRPPSSPRAWSRGSPPPRRATAHAHRRAQRGSSTPTASWPATWSRRCRGCSMHRSEVTIDLGAVRRNVARCCSSARRRRALGGRQGGRLRPRRGRRAPTARSTPGATALCVATVAEGAELRRSSPTRGSSSSARRGSEVARGA